MNQEILNLANKYVKEDGLHKTYIEGLSLFKSSVSTPRVSTICDLSLIIVLQGETTGYLGENTFQYNSQNYLVIPTSLALEYEIKSTKNEPFLAIFHKINKNLMYEVIDLIRDRNIQECKECGLGLFSDEITPRVEDTIKRLLEAMDSKVEAKILGTSLLKELYYGIAMGGNAHFLHKIFLKNTFEAKMTRTLKTIHETYHEHLDVQTLAKNEDMSASSFHTHFKNVTSMTPLQYIKKIRLNKAMDLLSKDNLQVKETAYAIGYESSFHFSKDFKRYYGIPPKEVKSNLSQANIAFGF
ncbi:MAG: AraC family transcriptional regulator [Campylobacteraceae bacterium]|nr:AraC family transcriptional regulator [Campylobacteraceae bacterium]